MHRSRFWVVASSLVMLLCVSPLEAQEPTPLTGYRVSSWWEEDGLPSGVIWALAQDADGFLWIGSDGGLVRFDGVRFRTWRELGGAVLPDGSVRALAVGHDGTLWAGFGDKPSIARIRDRDVITFGSTEGINGTQITALLEDAAGTMWAGTDKGLLRLSDGAWESVSSSGITDRVTALALSPSGDLYASTDRAIFERGVNDTEFVQLVSTPLTVQSIAVDAASHLWATDRNIGYRRVNVDVSGKPRLPHGKGYRLLPDSKGNLWVATYGQGVWLVRLNGADAGHVHAVTDFQGLSSNVIYALLEDRQGDIWVGTTAGLNRLAPQLLTQVEDVGVATGIEVTSKDTVWVNTSDGLTRFSLQAGEWRQQKRDGEPLRADAMHADARGTLWVASSRGVERFSASSVTLLRDRIAADLHQVKSITSSPDGTVWIFDSQRGLYRWKSGRLSAAPLPAAANGRRAVSIFADRTNRLWIVMQGETLISVDASGATRNYGASEGFTLGKTRMFFEDRDGTLWVVGSLGLSRFDQDRFITVRRDARLPLESLTSIVEDDSGRLWVGTGWGVVRITKAEFDAAAAGRWDEISPATFDATTGVSGTAGWTGQPSVARSGDGRLWFLTGTGITIIDPRSIQHTTSRVPVRVDGVSIDDRLVPVSDGMKVPSTATRLQIEFSAPTLSHSQTRFRYRLDGFDTTWINSGRLRTAIYTNLPPRAYQFQVQLQDVSGAWRDTGARWAFSVPPAFYQTTWFLGLCVVACVAVGWTAWRARVNQVRRQLAIVHGERARLSREIHDTLLQSLVGVALQCEALARNSTIENARQGLLDLRRQVEDYIRECRQSLWNLRSPALETHDLATALRLVAKRTAETAGMTLNMTISGTPQQCPGRIDDQLLRIGQEAVTNAVRHSGAREIRVHLDYSPTAVTLSVQDDGCGFDPDEQRQTAGGHWGLTGMHERATAAHGTLLITSSHGLGTSVVVTVPVSVTDTNDGEEQDQSPLHGRSPDSPRGDSADHQPAA